MSGCRRNRKLTMAVSGCLIIAVMALTVGLCVGLSGDTDAPEVRIIIYTNLQPGQLGQVNLHLQDYFIA